MNITRYFLKAEDSMGHKGFVPLWIPGSANFDVVTPLGLLHDCLEHGLSDTGTIQDEIIAFGRIVAMRGISNLVSITALGEEIAEFLKRKYDQTRSWPAVFDFPTTTVKLPKGHDTAVMLINRILDKVDEELENASYAAFAPIYEEQIRSMLCYGYRDAHRRYGGYSGAISIGYLMDDWLDNNHIAFDRMSDRAEFNDVLRVQIDTRDQHIQLKIIPHYYEYSWLRNKKIFWHMR